MNKLLTDLHTFNVRVDNLITEGFSNRDAEHIAEKELYNKLLKEAGL